MEELFQEFSAGLRAMAPTLARLAAENMAVSLIDFNYRTGDVSHVLLDTPAPWMDCVDGHGVSRDGVPWVIAAGVFDGVRYNCFLHPGENGYKKYAAMAKGGKK